MNKGLKKLEDDETIRIYGEGYDVLEIFAQDWDLADGIVTVSAIDELIEIQLYGEGSNCLETFEKCSILGQIKKDENFNHRRHEVSALVNTLSISRNKI